MMLDESLEDNPKNEQPQSDPAVQAEEVPEALFAIQSVNSLNYNDEPKGNPVEEDLAMDDDLVVVHNHNRNEFNQAEIIRLYQEEIEKAEIEKKRIEQRRLQARSNRKNNQKLPRQTSGEQAKDRQNIEENMFLDKSLKIKAKIAKNVTEYRTMHRPSTFDTRLQRYRYECKERLFTYCCFGIQQLLQLTELQLLNCEKQLLKQFQNSQTNQFNASIYNFCKRLVMQIDLEMLKSLNRHSKLQIARGYKVQWECLLSNIKDDDNFELRRKILNRSLTAKRIPLVNEIQFYTSAKRQEIIEKEKRYIAQFSVENAPIIPVESANNEVTIRNRANSFETKQQSFKPIRKIGSNKYIEESAISLLEQLLSDGHLTTMQKRLQEDLVGKTKDTLLEHFKRVFQM